MVLLKRHRQWPYVGLVLVHWAATLMLTYLVLASAREAADQGILMVPLWVDICALAAGFLCLPAALPVLMSQLIEPWMGMNDFALVFVLLALGNSVLVAWLSRLGLQAWRNRQQRRRGATA
jgi:hypothetical protein